MLPSTCPSWSFACGELPRWQPQLWRAQGGIQAPSLCAGPPFSAQACEGGMRWVPVSGSSPHDLPGCCCPISAVASPERPPGMMLVILQVLCTCKGAEGGKFTAAFTRSMRLSAYAEKITEAI